MGYNFNNVKPGDPYYANWCEKRWRSRMVWIAVIAWMPVTLLNVVVVDFVLIEIFEVHTPWGLLAILPPFLALILINFYVADWPCPRCGKPFYWRGGFFGGSWAFADNCLHCGLPEYAARDESADAPASTAITAQQIDDSQP
jgi:hypothetical protein